MQQDVDPTYEASICPERSAVDHAMGVDVWRVSHVVTLGAFRVSRFPL